MNHPAASSATTNTDVISIGSRPWNVRLVRQGDSYGLDHCLTHDEPDPMVEFYDGKQDPKVFGPLGQFVSRYYASTLRERPVDYALCLHGGVPAWVVGQEEMVKVMEWMATL